MTATDTLGSVGPALEHDLKSDVFDRYVIFTYSLRPELCSWFSDDDEVVICGPDKVVDRVYDTAPQMDATIKARGVTSHAKLFLMWGDDEIACWLGSFNFTFSGLYDNIEWAARFQGAVTAEFTPTELFEGEITEQPSDSWQVNQTMELVTSTFTGCDTLNADALLLNTEYPYVLVHSHRSNTLKRALGHQLDHVTGTVSITYYAPFVNARGIELFANTLAPAIDRDRIDLTVRTCRLREIEGSDSGLTPAQVADFESQFADFAYLVRAPGAQGEQLLDGRELRSGFAHHKSVLLEYTDGNDEKHRVSLLTSANLTKNAWQHDSGNFEIGLLLRDDERNEQLHNLLGPVLGHCYERPREPELEQATSGSTGSSPITETWLQELIEKRLTLDESEITIAWSSDLPALERITAEVYYRNLLDGSRTTRSVTFEQSADGFTASIMPITAEPDTVIDFITLDIDTAFRPPERRLTEFGIDQLLDGEMELTEYPCDIVLWDGDRRDPNSVVNSLNERPDEVVLRRFASTTRTIQIIHEPDSQPHFDSAFIQSIETGRYSDVEIGELLQVDMRIDSALTTHYNQVEFRRTTGGRIDPVGFAEPAEHTIRYLFAVENVNEELIASISSPLDRYYGPEEHSLSLPDATDGTAPAVAEFCTSQLEAQPATESSANNDIIDDETPIQFESATESPFATGEFDVIWGYRGYDRFGERRSIADQLPPQDPHRQIWFRGATRSQSDDTEPTLLTRQNSISIWEQPFVSTLECQRDFFPSAIDLDFLSDSDLVTWLVFERSAFLKEAVRGGDDPLSVTVMEDDYKYDRVICNVLDEGGFLCLPLLGQHCNRSIDFVFDLRLRGDHPEAEYYAPGRRVFEIQIDIVEDPKAVQLSWSQSTHRIPHQSGAPNPTLDLLSHRLSADDLANVLFEGDPFEVQDRKKLAIRLRRPGLLHLVSQ